jgi:hypothetical protein
MNMSGQLLGGAFQASKIKESRCGKVPSAVCITIPYRFTPRNTRIIIALQFLLSFPLRACEKITATDHRRKSAGCLLKFI